MSNRTADALDGAVSLAEPTANTNGHKPELDYAFRINGKEVRMKRSLSAKQGRWLPKLTQQMQKSGDLFDQVPLACLLIESWDFDGDPGKPESYDDFELFELTALLNAVGQHVNERAEGITTKN